MVKNFRSVKYEVFNLFQASVLLYGLKEQNNIQCIK